MCRFHSFVVTSSLDILEKTGEVHHSQLATPGVLTQALLPEFDVGRRRLDFDGRTLYEALMGDSRVPDNPRKNRWNVPLGSPYAGWDRYLGEEALSALESYLWQRFGTVERLVEFVEPWWDVARAELVGLLNKPPEPSHPSFTVPKLICFAGELLPNNVRWREFPGFMRGPGPILATGFLDSAAAREVAERNPYRGREPWKEVALLLTFNFCEDRIPYVWGRVHSSFDPKGRGFFLRGDFVFDRAVMGPNWTGLLPHSVAEFYFADAEDTRRAYRANEPPHVRALREMTYSRWADAMLRGDCVEQWKHDLDPDYAFGFASEPIYARRHVPTA